MADAEPTIKYTVHAGKPVVEVGGAWTVFSLRGIAAEGREGAAGGGHGKAGTPRRCQRRGAAGHGGRPGDPRPRRRRPGLRDQDRRQGACRPFRGRAEEHVRGAARAARQLVRPLARGSRPQYGQSLPSGHQSLRLLRRDPLCLRRGLPGAAPLPRQRRGAPDVRGLDPGAGDRGRAVLPDRRGDRLPGRPAAQAVRRRDLHGGSGRHRHVPRAGRSAHRHHRGRPLGQRLHRPDRHHAGQPGSRCHAHDRAQPRRMAGHAAHRGPGDLHAAARLLGRHDGPAGRCRRLHLLSRFHLRAVLRAAARHGGALALLHRHDQGAGVRRRDRHDRLLRGASGPRQRRKRRPAHDRARWSKSIFCVIVLDAIFSIIFLLANV